MGTRRDDTGKEAHTQQPVPAYSAQDPEDVAADFAARWAESVNRFVASLGSHEKQKVVQAWNHTHPREHETPSAQKEG